MYENAAGFDFVKMVPTAWDETRFLAGDIDDYVVVARRKGKDWYIGAMGNEKPHEISLPLKFLGAGKFKAKVWEDGATPTTLKESERDVSAIGCARTEARAVGWRGGARHREVNGVRPRFPGNGA